MDDLPETLERLSARIETLERRVFALEHPSASPDALPAHAPRIQQGLQPIQASTIAPAGGFFPVVGRAMLGIAGAYLLRAVAETGSIPMLAIATIAIAYAMTWLVWATRVADGAWFASATYACTSALILAPMLWELTLSFKVLPVTAAAGILAALVIAASALAWKRNLSPVFWVAYATASAVSIALMIATNEMAPFIGTILLMALVCEYAALRGHGTSVRPLVALAGDAAIWAMIFIYSSPSNARTAYPELIPGVLMGLSCLLFLIYALSTSIRTAFGRQSITVFEISQTTIAFLLSASSVMYFGSRTAATVLGILCIALSAAIYAAVFKVFDGLPERRNYHVFAAWSAALFVAGAWLCLPPSSLAACLGLAAVLATLAGVRMERQTLEFHGLVYLAAAAVASGLPDYCGRTLAWAFPSVPSWIVCAVSACALLCYAAEKHGQGEPWRVQLLHFVTASLTMCAVSALLVSALVWLATFRLNPGAHHVAFLRTLIACAAALTLAYSGAHWRRMELTRIGYAALVLIAAKLVFEDLRHGHLGFIAASIFLYAITLIAVPRLSRIGTRA
jgi:hypothetical protein